MDVDEFDTVMGQIGFGKVQCYAMFTLGLVQMLTIHETMGMGILAPAAVCDLSMSLQHFTALTTAAFSGIICSSYFWGYITDKMGRRWTLRHTLTISNICSVISMFMPTFTSFFIMRFLTGIFVSGPSFVAITYLSEFCNKQSLAHAVTYMYMFTGFAMCYCPGWATVFMSSNLMDFDIPVLGSLTLRPWRLLGCTFMLPGLIAFVFLLGMPESPKFLFMIGDTKHAMAVMDWISRKNTKHPLTPEQVQLMYVYQEKHKIQRRTRSTTIIRTMLNDSMSLFRKPYVGSFICSCTVMYSLGVVANGLGIWYTAMRNRSNMRQDDKSRMTMCMILFKPAPGFTTDGLVVTCDDNLIGFNDSFVLGACYIVLYNVCFFLLMLFKRKVLFVSALVISSCFGFALIFVLGRWLQLFCLAFFVALPGVVVSLLGGALIQFVPTHMRAKAVCIGLMWTRCGAVTGTFFVGIFIEGSCDMTLLIIAILPMFSASIEGFLPL